MTFALVLGWLRKVPREVWLILAFALAVLWLRSHWIGVGEARCQQAHEAAELAADARAKGAGQRAGAKAEAASAAITKVTEEAADEVRTIVRTVRAECPAAELPERVHDLGERAVERAREALRPAEG